MEEKTVYTIEEVAKELRVTERSVYSYVRTGRIKAIKVGRNWRITQAELNSIKKRGLRPQEKT